VRALTLGLLAAMTALAACHFDPSGSADPDGDEPDDGVPGPAWWDDAWGSRQRLAVTTGPQRPDKGYAGYTVRLFPFDTQLLQTSGLLTSNCDDLRLVTLDGSTWTERPYHLVGCGTAAADLRFAVPVDLGDNETWRDGFLYYDNPSASPPTAVTTTNVYLWWDDGTTDRVAQYDHGRMDGWLASGHDDSLAWNGAGYYEYATGDDTQSSYRRAVDERDVIVESEWMHTGCWNFNMQSGVCARGIISSGSGATEQADHYYCTSRAQNPNCSDNDQGIYDGDIVKTDNEVIALRGLSDPPPIATDQWRKQALAVFGAGPTELRFWDSDDGWPSLAFPAQSELQATGVDTEDYDGRGFAGVMTAQDAARVRNLVIRRYVEPEPTATLE